MSTSFNANFDLTILSGQTSSSPISSSYYHDAASLIIYAPTTLPETVKVEVHYNPDATGAEADWKNLVDSAGVDIPSPLADKARWYPEIPPTGAFRLTAGGAVGSDRLFRVTKNFTV